MACLVDWNIFNAPSASLCRKLFFFALLTCSAALSQTFGPANVHDCQPCRFAPNASSPVFDYKFEITKQDEGRVIRGILIKNQATGATQHLVIGGMTPIQSDEDFYFGEEDINFDGFADLRLTRNSGVANEYVYYWLYDSQTERYIPIGTYPVFKVNKQTRRLETYEREGYAGFEYEAKEFAFVRGKLTLMRDEKRAATKKTDLFRKTVREYISGTLKTTKTELVHAPKPQN